MAPVRWLLPLSWVYRLGVGLRNLGYELGWRRVVELPVPVVSVGSLTAGGTSKTPFVLWLVEQLRAADVSVGVLARGYGRLPGQRLNDEGRLLASYFPDLPQEQDPDRLVAGLALLARSPVDLILLDDGFQHRRLRRNLDICCLDARDPFAGGRLLPAGWLREPLGALDRANVLLLTGAEGMTRKEVDACITRVRTRVQVRPCFACATVPRNLLEMPGGQVHSLEELSGRRVALLAGIARPERFAATVEQLGAEIVTRRFLRDHAAIAQKVLRRASKNRQNNWLVITEKDEARLDLGNDEGPRRFVLRVGLEFVGGTPPLSVLLPPGVAAGAAS